MARKNFVSLLHDRDLSLRKLGEKTGIHFTWLSHMANGRRMPTLSRAVKISKALGITTDELFKTLPKERA